MARLTSCLLGFVPFTYLGLPIGSNMNHLVHWNGLIKKFKSKLSNWKANLLSIGGRSTLVNAILGSIISSLWSRNLNGKLGGDDSFTVKETREHIDDSILPTLDVPTIWCKSIPRKVNIFLWRLRLDRLPMRLNLSKRV
ncbi:hypothetical protein Tco_0352842 [Tanacetum coccineum]